MLSKILNIFGLVLVIYAINIIKKDLSNKKSIVNDLDIIEDRVKKYYLLTEKSIENFHEIIDDKLEIINNKNIEDPIDNTSDLSPNNNSMNISGSDSVKLALNPFHSKILELSSIGLTNDEIAKKLNKGKKEIEIILKIYNDKKTSKTI